MSTIDERMTDQEMSQDAPYELEQAQAELLALRQALGKINDIRNSIVGAPMARSGALRLWLVCPGPCVVVG